MNSKLFSGVFALGLLALSACGNTSKGKVSLAYPGEDARNTADALSAAITEHGHSPNCRDRKFCKFKYNEFGTVHFKLTKKDPVLVLEIEGEIEDDERFKLEQEMTKVAQDIWDSASSQSIEKEKTERAAKDEKERREDEMDLERERIASAERIEKEKLGAEKEKKQEETRVEQAKADEAAKKITESITFEPKQNGGAALKVEEPEGAVCSTQSDNSNYTKSLEVPFQVEAIPGSYYTVECVLPSGTPWRKKIQTKDRMVTVVKLVQGASK